ncbi:hypothetical protein RF11_09223 [Thelohanellus kitauei]|uniref:Uncharacterized protein n=1 Tax=Thelohanellus kitauei TaxID=669202 RepID=A0A0C2J089_THEKT|nr:hypothetical protein RF11_09223 [Thelohanellus kitauei]
MIKFAVLVIFLRTIESVTIGGWNEYRPVNEEEIHLLTIVKTRFLNGTSGLKSFNSDHAQLLQHAAISDIRVQTQLITTGDVSTPKLYLKVFQGLPNDPVIEVTYIGTEMPQ